MTYLAIARKYRPATFDEIVGQRHVTRTLTNAIESDRIHHAYLFTGARGVGKTTAARALARALNCESGPTATPCGTCTSCVEIGTGSSPDLIEIDGASNNSVDDVREIRDSVQYAPTHGRRKIYLVDEVHMLSKGAFNALLKTLEEPPPHVVFIFATTEPNKIPDTILSRVQRFDFKRISVPEVVDRLGEIATSEGVRLAPASLRAIARAGEGSMRDAQSLLDQVIAYGGQDITDAQVQETLGLIDRSQIHLFLDGMISGDPVPCLHAVDYVYSYGHELSVFTGELLEVLRHATFLRLAPQARRFVDLPDDEIDQLDQLTEGADPEHLARLFSALLEVHDQVSRAGRPRIVLEMAVARLATTRKAQPLAALLDRVEQLERSLRGQTPPSAGGGGRGSRSSGAARAGRSGGTRASSSPRATDRNPRASTSASDTPRASASPRTDTAHAPAAPEPRASTPAEPAPEPLPAQPSQIDDPWASVAPSAGPLHDISLDAAPQAPDRPSEPPTTDPWALLCQDLLRADRDLEPFTHGDALLIGSQLTVRFRPGRPLLAARKLSAHPAVARAIAARYPGASLTIEPIPRASQGSDLERAFLADPELQRIVRVLNATLEHIEAIEPDPAPPSPSQDPSS